jgi:hypothetical protein
VVAARHLAARQPFFGVRAMGVRIIVAKSPKMNQKFEFYIVCFI